MLKLLFLLCFFLLSSLYANSKVEIYASTLTSGRGIVNAGGGVFVLYEEYILSAKRARYDRKTGELELFGHIRASHKNKYKVLGDYAKLNLAKKEHLLFLLMSYCSHFFW